MKTLSDIVNEAYRIFSDNEPGEHLDACTHCCMKEADAKLLKSIPLKQIPLKLLQEYQDAAKPENLNIKELKYFAPKYLEFIKDYQYPSYEPLLSLNRFGYFDKSDWTTEEWKLLNDFAIEFYKKYIRSAIDKTCTTPIEILLMFYKGNLDVRCLLREWEKCSSPESLLHFNQLLEEISFDIHEGPTVMDAFSDDTFSNLVCHWLFSERVKGKFKKEIEQAILEPNASLSESDLTRLSWTYDLIK